MSDRTASVIEIVSSVLKLAPGAVGPDDSVETLPQWDSLAHLNICLRIEERFGIDMDMDVISEATSVAKLAALLPPGAA
ncbi:MAG: acyl carrier protein [Candidatus Baltobacteraceae bacterium]|jgi:acyl carrier protein